MTRALRLEGCEWANEAIGCLTFPFLQTAAYGVAWFKISVACLFTSGYFYPVIIWTFIVLLFFFNFVNLP